MSRNQLTKEQQERLTADELAEYDDLYNESELLQHRLRNVVLRREELKRKAMGHAYRFQRSHEPT